MEAKYIYRYQKTRNSDYLCAVISKSKRSDLQHVKGFIVELERVLDIPFYTGNISLRVYSNGGFRGCFGVEFLVSDKPPSIFEEAKIPNTYN